jgi:hypothetical protein
VRALLVGVGIIAIIAIGAFVLRDKLAGNAGDLQVGDCFDPPTTAATVVKDVQHRPCTDAHLAEVFFVGDYDVATSTYPTDDDFDTFVADRCVDAFQAYVGQAYGDSDLDFAPYWPTEDGWGRGDREVTCFAYRLDGATITGSVKQASGSAGPPPAQSRVSPTNGMPWRVSASTLMRSTAVFALATSRT